MDIAAKTKIKKKIARPKNGKYDPEQEELTDVGKTALAAEPAAELEADEESLPEDKTVEPAATEVALDEQTQAAKQEILASLPKVQDAAKPEPIAPRDQAEAAYYKEHQALPVETERPLEAVQAEAEQLHRAYEQDQQLMEEGKDETRTMEELAQQPVIESTKPEDQQQVEAVLQQGLEEYYQAMTPAQQQEFKNVGEQTALKITAMLRKAKVQAVKILELIKAWLRLIPGVNKYFLEQESKIKTDALMKIKQSSEGSTEMK